jgi:hypothetical protein
MSPLALASGLFCCSEPKPRKNIVISMFSDKETVIVEACLLVSVPVSIWMAVLSALLFR